MQVYVFGLKTAYFTKGFTVHEWKSKQNLYN